MPQGSKNTDPPAEPDQVARRRIELGAAAHRGMEVAPSSSNFTPLWNNPVTMAGMFLAIVALLGLLTFALFQFVAPSPNPYVDIVGYLVIPGILILGLLVMPLGVLWRSWRMRRRDPTFRLAFGFPRVDLNDPIQRRAAKVVVGGTFILLPAVGVSSYHGYHYTDSTEFCSKACHVVMEPQAVTYAQSGHARVACAECHIGSGASWFVKSKLSGTRQVIAVWRNNYSRPIPPAIRHLRPARETCEQCHWPEKFFGDQLAVRARFAADEANTAREIKMLLKTGGWYRSARQVRGIHLHVALAGRIEYVAADDKLQDIPWVKFTNDGGDEVVYRSDGGLSSAPAPVGQRRVMDCMDCHNRPAHRFLAPADAVDIALHEGTIDPTLPFVKRETVAALVQPHPDKESAEAGIAAALSGFYRTTYPEVWKTRRDSVLTAVEVVKDIYRRSFFSTMKVDWRTYPDNIGHMYSPGCFRCHDGHHVDQDGNSISHACSSCHTFFNTVVSEGRSTAPEKGEFVHAPQLEGRHAELRCDRCHTGGIAPGATCAGCHVDQAAFRAGTLEALAPFDVPAEPMADSVDCESCHDLAAPVTAKAIDAQCVECHDEEYQGLVVSWAAEAERLLSEAEGSAGPEGLVVLRRLREAGPLHNMEATRRVAAGLKEEGL